MLIKNNLSQKVSQLQYYASYRPSLLQGEYTLAVEQKVHSTDGNIPPSESFREKKTFTVQSERFNLKPAEFYSIFPPANGTGEYSDVLPHIVFCRKTLLWDRNPGAPLSSTPWLALLLFSENDPPITCQIGTRNELLPIAQGGTLPTNIFFPLLSQEYGESLHDPTAYIDITPANFYDLLPSGSDLNYLAHGRTAYLDNYVDAQFSVLVCNRFPTKNKKNTVHLISLEGYGPYIEDRNKLTGYDRIRLVSLKNWSFTSLDPKTTFSGILKNVNTNPCGLIRRCPTASVLATSNALNMGYIPLNHHTRQGDKTISWYRGPLAPYPVNRRVTLPVVNPDQVTYYDPEAGMFDVSYSLAWQIGRLLALQNKGFSEGLYRWKRENWKKLINGLEVRKMRKRLGIPLAQAPTKLSSLEYKAYESSYLLTNLKKFVGSEGGEIS